jgi:hypothetical protein
MLSSGSEISLVEKNIFQSLNDSPSVDSLSELPLVVQGNKRAKLVLVKNNLGSENFKSLRSSVTSATLRDYYLSLPYVGMDYEPKEPVKMRMEKLQQKVFFINYNSFSHPIQQGDKSYKSIILHLLSTIFSFPRDYVICLSDSYIEVLAEFITDIDFFTINIDGVFPGKPSKGYRFTRLTIRYEGRDFIVGIADSYNDSTLNGEMLSEYGSQALTILKRGMVLKNPLWGTSNSKLIPI